MKRILTLALVLLMAVSCMVSVSAGWCDEAFQGAKFTQLQT